MSLYLCVFRGEEEIDGLEVGSYDDFGRFRDGITERLENGNRGSRFPVLQLHADSEGEWCVDECRRLWKELEIVEKEFSELPPVALAPDQKGISPELDFTPHTLAESLVDVDGESLLRRLAGLCRSSIDHNLPILFQ